MVHTCDIDVDDEDRTVDVWVARTTVIKTMGRIKRGFRRDEKRKTVVG